MNVMNKSNSLNKLVVGNLAELPFYRRSETQSGGWLLLPENLSRSLFNTELYGNFKIKLDKRNPQIPRPEPTYKPGTQELTLSILISGEHKLYFKKGNDIFECCLSKFGDYAMWEDPQLYHTWEDLKEDTTVLTVRCMKRGDL